MTTYTPTDSTYVEGEETRPRTGRLTRAYANPYFAGILLGVVLLVVLMALFMFWGAEQLERIFGKKDPKEAPRWRYGAAGVLVAAAVGVIALGQPTTADRWDRIAPEMEAKLAERAVQIHPGELLGLMEDRQLKTVILDVRSEVDYNQFHIHDARNVPLAEIPSLVTELHFEPANAVFVLVSNDETAATEAWKTLVAESIPNAYILEGGINNWVDTFADDVFKDTYAIVPQGDDRLHYAFPAALGSRYPAAEPNPKAFALDYTEKVQLEEKRAPTSGGCG